MSALEDKDLSVQQSSILRILVNITDDKLKEICGVRNLKRARALGNYKVVVKDLEGSFLNIEFKTGQAIYHIRLNLLGEQNRSECSCTNISFYSKRKRCEHVGASILYLKDHPEIIINSIQDNAGGEKLSKEEIAELQKDAEERRKKIESLKLDPLVIENTLIEVKKMIILLHTQGLQRFSRTSIDWLNDLLIKTQIAKLANINKELKKIVELIRNYLDKSVLFNMNDYKYRLNQLTNYYLLSNELIKGGQIQYPEITPDIIIGKFRSKYIPHEDLIAQCVGMSGWKSKDNNFIGCTGYYLDLSKSKLFSISNVLPTSYFGTDPNRIYTQPIKTIGISMSRLAHGAFKFINVKFNDKGNLSLHKALNIFQTSQKDVYEDQIFSKFKIKDWLNLIDTVCNFETTPIRLPYSLSNYFILEPTNWGMFDFDAISQEYKASLIDENKNLILLRVLNEPHNKLIIRNLQMIYKDASIMPNALLGSVFVKDGFVSINPLTLFWYQGIKLSNSRGIHATNQGLISEFHLNLERAENLTLI